MIGIMKEKYPSYYQEGLIVTGRPLKQLHHLSINMSGNEYLLTVPMFLVMFIVTVLITPLYIVILKLRYADNGRITVIDTLQKIDSQHRQPVEPHHVDEDKGYAHAVCTRN